jgi:hypothetical protein
MQKVYLVYCDLFKREKGRGMLALTCTVCGEAYLPVGRWRDETCQPCFEQNFAASEELRLHQRPHPDPEHDAQYRRNVEEFRAAFPLTPRQQEAMRRIAEGWLADSQEEDGRG